MFKTFTPQTLSPLIDTIWYSDSEVDPHEGHVVPPGLGADLILKIYPSHTETVLSGPVTKQRYYPFVPGTHYYGISFRPGVGPIFREASLKELTDTSVSLNHLLNIDWDGLSLRLREVKGWAAQTTLLNDTLCRHYPGQGVYINPNVLQAMSLAQKFSGNLTVADLVAAINISRRQLERLFRHYVGLSPKTFCRVLRIQRVLALLAQPHPPSLAQLALTCGYTDQAHLSHEFKAVMGQSMLQYAQVKIA